MNFLRLTLGGVLVFAFLFSSCEKDVSFYGNEIPKGKIVMKNHSPQRVSDNMILEITDINDSRCPLGVVCSSTGSVDISFKAYVDSTFSDFSVSFEQIFQDQVTSTNYEGHLIEIYRVNPHPYEGVDIDPDDYIVVVQVQKL